MYSEFGSWVVTRLSYPAPTWVMVRAATLPVCADPVPLPRAVKYAKAAVAASTVVATASATARLLVRCLFIFLLSCLVRRHPLLSCQSNLVLLSLLMGLRREIRQSAAPLSCVEDKRRRLAHSFRRAESLPRPVRPHRCRAVAGVRAHGLPHPSDLRRGRATRGDLLEVRNRRHGREANKASTADAWERLAVLMSACAPI